MEMDRDFLRQGSHTWDLATEYHRCAACGHVFESRGRYEDRYGKREKDLECPGCHNKFTVTQKRHITFGPLFGR